MCVLELSASILQQFPKCAPVKENIMLFVSIPLSETLPKWYLFSLLIKSSGLASFVRLFNSQMSFNGTRFKLWHLSSSLHSCTHSERLLASRVLNVWPRSIMPWIDDSLPQFVVVTLESCISMKITRMTENWRPVMLLNFCILNSYLGERYYLRYHKDQTFGFRLKNLSS